ncbi:MAG: type II secretion system protein [Chitinivibrionales bacterium]|nr:type II secretion system protein [Chitinivibrionales bacterium]
MKRNATTSSCSGYSLVELLVAAVILTLIIAVVVASIRKGSEIDVADNYRRQARALIINLMETDFNHRNFNTLQQENVTIPVSLSNQNGHQIGATIQRSVVGNFMVVTGTTFPVWEIDITVRWPIPAVPNQNEMITLRKVITYVN